MPLEKTQKGLSSMKKETLRAAIVAAVVLVVYHLVVFLIPFAKTGAFWISYIFGLAAFAVAGVSIYMTLFKNPDAKSRFYGFPIARIGVVYCALQLVASLIVMALALWIPGYIAAVVYAIGLGIAIIGLISAEVVAEEIQIQEVKLKKDVSRMRTLQSKVGRLAAQSEDTALKALAEEFRYSDPVSSEALEETEAELEHAVEQLEKAVENGDALEQICKKLGALLAERNRICKLNKSNP